MRSFPNFSKAVSAIKSQVPFHPLVSVQPKFAQPEPDGPLVGKVKQCCSKALLLCIRLYGYAVDQQVIRLFFEDSDACWLAFNFQDPDLSPINAWSVILCGRFWDRAEHSHVRRNVGIRTNTLDRFFINWIGLPEFDGNSGH